MWGRRFMSNIDSNKQFGTYTMGQNHVLEGIWLKYKSNPEGTWVTKINQAVRLHEYLKKLQPKHILELGTGIGCSTEIMAFTCPNTSIYTVEQNQKCIDAAKILIPEKLQEQIYFKLAEPTVLKPLYEVNPFIHFMAYKTPYDWQDYDFIYVDGPGPFRSWRIHPETKQRWETLVDLPCGDVMLILHRINEGTLIYFDKRHLTTHLYKRHLMHYLELVEETPEHTVFRRNDRPLKPEFQEFMNSDRNLGILKDNRYFTTKLDESNQ